MSKKMHIKKGDMVIMLSGKDRYDKEAKGAKSKPQKVLEVSPSEGKVIVERLNLVKKHVKPRKMGDPGGIITAESAVYACKVQIVCPHCHQRCRVQHKTFADGSKVRICHKCQEQL